MKLIASQYLVKHKVVLFSIFSNFLESSPNTAVGHAHSLLGWDMQIRIRECYYGVIWRTCKLG